MVEYIVANDGVASSSLVSCSVYLTKEFVMCGCGRSPREDGKCVGFHKLNETEWNEQKETLVEIYLREIGELDPKE